MDSLITAAGRALAAGDPLGALRRVALRDDASGLALRGIAMAQLGDLPRAVVLLRRAGRAFGAKEPVARARCVVAEAEIALAARNLGWPAAALDAATATLEAHGDRANVVHARLLAARRLLLIGRVDAAAQVLGAVGRAGLTPSARAVQALVAAGIAIRRLRTAAARAALAASLRAARAAGIPALVAEVARVAALLDAPAARVRSPQGERPLRLAEVERLLASDVVVVDGCRYLVRDGRTTIRLASRPVLFALAQALGEAWPGDVARDALVARAFGAARADESHRARLRVEAGRLRRLLRPVADITATPRGFTMTPRRGRAVVALARPTDEPHGAVLALLADGEAWSTSALALALDTSQRSVQRALDTLAAEAKVQSLGRGRSRRWVAPPLPGFTTALLLPAPLPVD